MKDVAGTSRPKTGMRAANFIIAALCYLLLFVFIFNIKTVISEMKSEEHILFAATEGQKIPEPQSNKEQVKKDKTKEQKIPPKPVYVPPLSAPLPPKPQPILKAKDYLAIGANPALKIAPGQAMQMANLPLAGGIATEEVGQNIGEGTGSKANAKAANNDNKSGDSNVKETAKSQYIEKVLRRIENKKSYPLRARELHLEGVVVIGVKISRNGYLLGVRVVKSSKIPLLDDAALLAVKNAAPFDKFPAEIDNDSLNIETPIEFDLKV